MNNPDQETKSEKPAPLIDLMSPKIFYPIWLWILLLIVFIIILFTGKNLNEIIKLFGKNKKNPINR